MSSLPLDQAVLRYCRQVVMQTMDHVRERMREDNLQWLKCQAMNPRIAKSEQNMTMAIDQEAEDMIVAALQFKLAKLKTVKAYTLFSEEMGIKTFPEGTAVEDADLVVFVDPIDGPEFVEALQGGWCLIAAYDRRINDVIAAVAGDIFLDRLYWASSNGYAECLDFITHSWFRLDGGVARKTSLAGGVRVKPLDQGDLKGSLPLSPLPRPGTSKSSVRKSDRNAAKHRGDKLFFHLQVASQVVLVLFPILEGFKDLSIYQMPSQRFLMLV
jgi:hypothetical protein